MMLAFGVLAWLPRFSFVNQMVFAVMGMGIAFLLVLAVFNVTTTQTELFTNSSFEHWQSHIGGPHANFPENITYTANVTTWVSTTTTYDDVYPVSYVFLMIGLVLALRFILLMLSVWKGTSESNRIM